MKYSNKMSTLHLACEIYVGEMTHSANHVFIPLTSLN